MVLVRSTHAHGTEENFVHRFDRKVGGKVRLGKPRLRWFKS